ncbi:hypothetical protein B0T22DRAFT_388623 [Podospora appendiculata]|uniref:DUF4604 domain-containing protein n=1 Tax=Podospora appendiculata TaxID=314037 RepID=A0AAE0WZK6_9PEZI|nr:hypothetical protein B0T22DRAFT_388623 [Podospora appendiculata]
MSGKITSKNLHYDTALPPFLARLRGEATSAASDGPDPLLAAQRRPTKKRSGSADAEDAPLVVDERGHTVDGRDGYVVGRDGVTVSVNTDGNIAKDGEGDADAELGAVVGTKEGKGMVAVGGEGQMKKKRKAGRVVGGGDDDDEDEKGSGGEGYSKKATRIVGGEDKAAAAKSKPSKKKAKKIKLSFGDDEG